MMGGAWFEQHFGDPNDVNEQEIAEIAINEARKQIGAMEKPIRTIVNIQKVRFVLKFEFNQTSGPVVSAFACCANV